MWKFLAIALANARTSMVSAFLCLFLSCGSPQIFSQDMPDVSETFRQASEAMQRGDLNTAGEGFAAAAKQSPAFAEAHFNLGLVREEQGRFEEAIASLQKSLTLKPRLHGANLFLGVAYYRMNRFELALAAAKRETTAYPKDASAWMWQGVIQLAMDRPEDAATTLDKAATLAPDNADVLYHRGKAHLLVSNNSYAKMFKADPKSWHVHQVLAQANSEAERPLDAIAEYLEAIKLAPTQPGLHEELGAEYRSAGKPSEAEAAFQKELEINPFNALARYKLGILAIERGDGAGAKELIEAALKLKPGLRHADYNLARAEMLLGQDENALKHLLQVTTTENDPEVLQQTWFQLSIVYRRLHRMAEAQQAIATFQKLKNEEAEKSQEQLKKFKVQQDPEVAQPTDTDSKPE
jgi:tetratricopeptide (TPR) repeat protein